MRYPYFKNTVKRRFNEYLAKLRVKGIPFCIRVIAYYNRICIPNSISEPDGGLELGCLLGKERKWYPYKEQESVFHDIQFLIRIMEVACPLTRNIRNR